MQEVIGSTPIFSTKLQRTAFRKGRRFLLDSPPLHVQHARVPLEAAQREGQNECSEQRVLPEGDQDVHPCVGAAHRVLGGRDDGEAQKDGEEAVVFALQDVAQGELDVRCRPAQVARPKRRHVHRPIQVGLAEFAPQKRLLGKHDALVVQPVNEAAHDHEPHVAHVNHDAQPHEVVAEVEGVAHQAVHALGVEDFGDLSVLGVAARGAARRVADGQGADELANQRNRNARDRRNRVKGLEKGV